LSEYAPIFSTKATGHVTATFNVPKTPEEIARVVDWIRGKGWKGCLQINMPGNGGVSSVIFAETAKPLREEAEIKS
jgi:hypothetical protein